MVVALRISCVRMAVAVAAAMAVSLAASRGVTAQNAAPPPPPPSTAAPVRVGGNIRPPVKSNDVRPVYPSEALAAGVQGVVIVEATIGPDGIVQDTRVLRSIPLLDTAALSAVRQWQFAPTMLNGAPVSVIMTVTVNFTLDELTPRACAEEPSLKSATSSTPRTIRFVNASAAPKKVFWLDSSGERRLYATVEPQGTFVQPTFEGNSWLVTDARDQCTAIYLPIGHGGQATLR